MPSAAHGKIDGIEDRDEQFYVAVQGEDDLGLVLRAQIHIEHEVREYIVSQAPAPNEVKFKDLEYDDLVQLALILGLNGALKSPLNALGSLRNKFAHRLDANLGAQEADNLYKAFGEGLKDVTQRTFKLIQADHPEVVKGSFKGLAARDRVIFMLIAIRSALLAERLLAEKKA